MQMTEGNYLGDLLKWEMDNNQSREIVTIAAGEALAMGAVLGKVTAGTVPATGTAGTNTGANTCTGVTGGVKVKPGVYTLRCVTAVASGGVYTVSDPDGMALPSANVGVAYTSNQINFTLNDAGADATVGDSFTITVPAGSGAVQEFDPAAIDGTATPHGFLIDGVDTTDTTQRSVAFTSGGVIELRAGDVVTGATSGATAQIVSISVTSGTWAAGTAAGTLVVDNQVGTFQSENLDAVSQANICTIGANTAAYTPAIDSVAIVRDAQIVADYLSWKTGVTSDQQTAALLQLAYKGIVTRVDA